MVDIPNDYLESDLAGAYTESVMVNVMPGDRQLVIEHMLCFGYHSADASDCNCSGRQSRYRFTRLRFLRDIRIEHYDALRDACDQYLALLQRRNELVAGRGFGGSPFVCVCMLLSALLTYELGRQVGDASEAYSLLVKLGSLVFAVIGVAALGRFAYITYIIIRDRVRARRLLEQMDALAAKCIDTASFKSE